MPPTYRERVPDAVPEKEREKEDAGSSGAPTNGVNTPANALEPTEPPRGEIDSRKEGANADAVAPEITAEEEEWLKKLNESQMAWYPWPSNEKIRLGNLYKLMYYREKNYNLDEFNIPAFEEEDRLKNMAVVEAAPDEQPQEQQQPPPGHRQPRPREKQEAFTLFDDMDEED